MRTTQEKAVIVFRRSLTIVLIGMQALFAVPSEVLAAGAKDAVHQLSTASRVSVNRTVPTVSPPPSRPVFSTVPTDAEILRARVFAEPLIPIGLTSATDNVALVAALNAYLDARDPTNIAPIVNFMVSNPTSAWQASLLLNLGTVLLRHGYISRATHDFEFAWNLTNADTSPNATRIADAAIGELVSLEARLGHADRVDEILTRIGSRPVGGAATERVSDARQALSVMRGAPEEAFRCGPYALVQMIEAYRPGTLTTPKLLMTRTGPKGSSLSDLTTWAKSAGVNVVAIEHRSASYPVPSVIHFSSGHFAAVLKRNGGQYLVRDPAFGGEAWISEQALHEEASGFLLVPQADLPASDRVLNSDEANQVRGKGFATSPEDQGPQNQDPQTPRTCPAPTPGPCSNDSDEDYDNDFGMFGYRIDLMMASIHIQDMPVRYAPPVGPHVLFSIGYNQRESHQPQTFTYSNLGPKWTFDWLTYVVDDPTNPGANVGVFQRGGGQDTYTGFDVNTGLFTIETRQHRTLKRVNSSPIRYELVSADGTLEVFTASDGALMGPRRVFMTEWHDPRGNALTFAYDAQMRMVAVRDAIGQVTTVSYELPQDVWKITKVTDPFGRSAHFTYDGSGHLLSSTDTLGLTSYVTCGNDGVVTSITTPYGTTRFTTSDGEVNGGYNRVVEATDPLGAKEHVEYRANDLSRSQQDPLSTVPSVPGYSFTNDYLQYRNTLYWNKRAMALGAGDATQAHLYHWLHLKGNVNQSSSILESEKPALENRIWYLYPNQASPVFEGDGREPIVAARVLDDGTTQAYLTEINSLGHVTKRTDPVGRQTTLSYAANGIDVTQVMQTTGGLHDTLAAFTYNNQHEPLTITDAAGQTTTLTYNAAGQPLTSTNARSDTTTFTYSASGQLQTVIGPITGATATFTYDGYGRVRTTTDADSYVVTNDYDAADRLTQAMYPDGTSSAFVYDRLDLVRVRDRANRWTSTGYDALRRPVSVRDTLGRVITQAWCTCGTLNSLTDPNGHATSWDRDVRGRATKETRPNGSFVTYVYENTTSRLKTVTDPKLQVATYSYASDDALSGMVYTNATIATPSVSFTYDALYPRLATMVDGTGTTAYTYQPAGTLGAGQVATVDGPLSDDTITYGYDVLGRIASRTLNSVTNTWSYDALGRVSTQGDPIGIFTYAYDGPTRRLQQLTYPNGQTSTYAYFGNSGDRRLQDIHHQTGAGATQSRFTYAYDTIGNITTWTQQYGTDVKAYDFTYDTADQLTAAVYRTTDPTPTVLKRYGYGYDPSGNRTGVQTDDTPVTYAYDNMNRLTTQTGGGIVTFAGTTNEAASVTIQGQAARSASPTAFSGTAVLASGTTRVAITATDASGNTASQSYDVDVPLTTGAFTYDANGNLTAQGTKTYEWDAANRLTRALDDGVEIARFTYDGFGRRAQKITSETRTYVYDGVDMLQERASAGTTRHLVGPATDQLLLSVDPAGAAKYSVADHLGSIVQQTDATGTAVLVRQYDPSGVPLQGQASSGFAFTGREWDAETGLYFYRARYYDPTIGRFLSEDPVGIGDADLNLFAYVGNAPVGRVDPLGRDWVSAGMNFASGVVTGAVSAAAYAAVAAIGATAAAGAAVVAVGVGAYQGTIALQQVVGGFDPYTGRSLSTAERVDIAASIAGGIVGGGAMAAASGPSGPIWGRGRLRNGQPGWLNQGDSRMGWSWNAKNGRNEFCYHGGKPGVKSGPNAHWHGPWPSAGYPTWLPPWIQSWW